MRLIRGALLCFVFTVLMGSAALAGDAERGKKFFNDPHFAGSTNTKSCNSCHQAGRGVEKSGEKPSFSLMGEKKESLEDVVNSCIRAGLKGRRIRNTSPAMRDITSYIKSLQGKKFKKMPKIVGC